MKDYIMKKISALDKKDCYSLINCFNDEKTEKFKGPVNNFTKENNDYFYEYLSLDVSKYVFFKPLTEAIEEYKLEHKFLNSDTFGVWGIARACNFQKYYPGKCYSVEHCEHGYKESSRRVLAWMIYLNDIKNGDGGTYFPQQRRTLIPAAGDLYIWPAGWTHSHLGLIAEKDEKYIITGWCQFN